MKTYEIRVVTTCTQEFYEEELKSLKKEIESGEFQREMCRGEKGDVVKIKATFKEIKK